MNADLIDAGAMNAGHAEVEACEDCHIAFDRGRIDWMRAAFTEANPKADNDKCLACHKWGEDSLNAHTLPRPELATLIGKFDELVRETSTEPSWNLQVSRAVFPAPLDAHNGNLACGACHKEHEGEASNLSEVSNARCQSCHQLTFNAFSDGHPSFGDYPYLRRTRIVFDHDSHNRKNFPEKKKQGIDPPETCDSCHSPDGTGRFMLTADFAVTCAQCHSEDIIGETVAGPKGTPIIAVPELDLETLKERGVAIGEWPETPLAFDISPYTKLLIASDPTIADDLTTIAETDLQDLTEASDAELQAVARLAWAIKGLMFDLIISGMEILQSRVEASLNNALDTDTVGRLIGHIPQDVIAAAGAAWFPNLKQELVAYREATTGDGLSPGIQGDDADDDLSGDQTNNDQAQSDARVILAQAGTIEVEELPAGSDPAAENEALGLPTLDPEEWASAGGWYRKDYILYYRPVGHEDVVLRTWLDISARSFGTPAERYGDELFQLLADKNTPGKCSKCHSIDQQAGGGLAINWGPFKPVIGENKFTNFVHSTHFSAVGSEGCIACHRLNEDPNYQESYKQRDPNQFVANFAPMKQEVCADCHVQQSAGDNCTQCHQYHIGEFITEAIPSTRIDDLDKTKPDAEENKAPDDQVDARAEEPSSGIQDLASQVFSTVGDVAASAGVGEGQTDGDIGGLADWFGDLFSDADQETVEPDDVAIEDQLPSTEGQETSQ